MAQITLKGNSCNTNGDIPAVGAKISDFKLVNGDLETVSLANFTGQKLVLNCFPSIDTPVCAASVKKFNEDAAALENVSVLCISKDLPFATKRFCGAEGIEDVVIASAFRDDSFGQAFGIQIVDGPLEGLLARAVIVADQDGKVLSSQLVSEIAEEPDYDKALEVLKS